MPCTTHVYQYMCSYVFRFCIWKSQKSLKSLHVLRGIQISCLGIDPIVRFKIKYHIIPHRNIRIPFESVSFSFYRVTLCVQINFLSPCVSRTLRPRLDGRIVAQYGGRKLRTTAGPFSFRSGLAVHACRNIPGEN